jgi:hypothetical protein
VTKIADTCSAICLSLEIRLVTGPVVARAAIASTGLSRFRSAAAARP